jgi:hypothetical protein
LSRQGQKSEPIKTEALGVPDKIAASGNPSARKINFFDQFRQNFISTAFATEETRKRIGTTIWLQAG